jgi:hypothetical protein
VQRVGEDILEALRAAAVAPRPPSVGEVLSGGGASAFAVALVVLCLPFLQPISLGPLSTLGGLALAALGWQLARGDVRPWLPGSLADARLDAAQWAQLARAAERVLGWAGKVVRPRLGHWTEGARGRRTAGVLVAVAGLLLAIPIGGIPLNNTLPALAIVCASLALLADDGLMFLLSVGWLVVTLVYFVLLYRVFVAMLATAWGVLGLWPVGLVLLRAGAASLGLTPPP